MSASLFYTLKCVETFIFVHFKFLIGFFKSSLSYSHLSCVFRDGRKSELCLNSGMGRFCWFCQMIPNMPWKRWVSQNIFVVLLSGEITWFVLFVFVDVLQAEEVRQVADSELGFQQVTLSSPSQAKTYLFVNTDRMVVGCLVAEHIRQVWRVSESFFFFFKRASPDCVSAASRRTESWSSRTNTRTWVKKTSWSGTEPGAAPPPRNQLCAGSVGFGSSVWPDDRASPHACWTQSGTVSHHVSDHSLFFYKQKPISQSFKLKIYCTYFVPLCRSTFIFGSHLSKTEIAFSDPTPDGKLFASNYCNTPTFLVYNFISWDAERSLCLRTCSFSIYRYVLKYLNSYAAIAVTAICFKFHKEQLSQHL